MEKIESGCAWIVYRFMALVVALVYLSIAASGLWLGLFLPVVAFLLLVEAAFMGLWFAGLKAFKGEPSAAEPMAFLAAVLNVLLLVLAVFWIFAEDGNASSWKYPEIAWIGQNLFVCLLGILYPGFAKE